MMPDTGLDFRREQIAARCFEEGQNGVVLELARSTTTSHPSSASRSPLVVSVFTPVAGEAATAV
ncbi:hypothetical protein QF001_002489 [Paraburkholderia youngii]